MGKGEQDLKRCVLSDKDKTHLLHLDKCFKRYLKVGLTLFFVLQSVAVTLWYSVFHMPKEYEYLKIVLSALCIPLQGFALVAFLTCLFVVFAKNTIQQEIITIHNRSIDS